MTPYGELPSEAREFLDGLIDEFVDMFIRDKGMVVGVSYRDARGILFKLIESGMAELVYSGTPGGSDFSVSLTFKGQPDED